MATTESLLQLLEDFLAEHAQTKIGSLQHCDSYVTAMKNVLCNELHEKPLKQLTRV